jgi:hypothetical protein
LSKLKSAKEQERFNNEGTKFFSFVCLVVQILWLKARGWNLAELMCPRKAHTEPRFAAQRSAAPRAAGFPAQRLEIKPFAPQEKCIADTHNSLQSNVM